MIVCRRCHRLCTPADFVFVPVKTLADCLNNIPGDRGDPVWRTSPATGAIRCGAPGRRPCKPAAPSAVTPTTGP